MSCLLRIEAVTVPSQYDNRFYYANRQSYNQPHCPHWMGQAGRPPVALRVRPDGAGLSLAAGQDLLPFSMDRHACQARINMNADEWE